jgi:hypothetical protein
MPALSQLCRKAPAVAVLAFAALSLAACNNNTGPAGGGQSSGSAPAKAAGASTEDAGGGTSTAAACATSDLDFSWVSGGKQDPAGGVGQYDAVVALKNKSGHACAMHGYPGVDLVNSGTQWSLTRASAPVKTVTLAGGASAQFTITYLAWRKGDSAAFAPTTVVITPPNQRSSYDIPWKWGQILLQDGATHPGTYVGPVHS